MIYSILLLDNHSIKEQSLKLKKILTEIHSKAQGRSIGKMALCYVLDNNEIKGVGGSTLLKDKKRKIISNLILDQFGIWLAGIFRKNVGGNTSIILKDNTDTNRTVNIYGDLNNFNRGLGTTGSALKVGSGNTAPARTDFGIETPFVTTPESLNFALGANPIYSSGLANFKTAGIITAGGAGTINESVHEMIWRDSALSNRVFTIFRDIISPAVPFIAGQSIALEYTIQL